MGFLMKSFIGISVIGSVTCGAQNITVSLDDLGFNLGEVTFSDETFLVSYSTGGQGMCLPSADCPEFWITGPNCEGSACGTSKYTGPFIATGSTFDKKNSDGSEVGGDIVLVYASIANTFDTLTSLVLVSNATDIDFQNANGGYLGLTRAGTLVPSLYRSGLISNNLFSIWNPQDGPSRFSNVWKYRPNLVRWNADIGAASR